MDEKDAEPRASLLSRDNAGPSREFSAGGVVVEEGKVLLVRVRNLRGDLLWTFPKGHVEKGEGPEEAARREVEEETGYRCRILSSALTVRYQFTRGGRRIQKRVQWYWMRPGARLGKPDGAEVLEVKWFSYRKARERIRYPSDKELLARTERRFPLPARSGGAAGG